MSAHFIRPTRISYEEQRAPFGCRLTRKRSYDSIAEAWISAFIVYAFGKSRAPLTPYRCDKARMYTRTIRLIGHPDPKRWRPATLVLQGHWRRINIGADSCGRWHLTSTTSHLLGAVRDI